MNGTRPKISIVVPVYNPGAYFPACLASLEAQTIFDALEVVLVDDGSTDGSGALCDEFSERHPGQVQVFHQPNRGLGAARNTAIDAAEGEWILLVDSDDAIIPNACERLLSAGESTDADLVWGDYAHVSSCIGGVAEFARQGKPVEMWRILRVALHEGSYVITPCHYLYRKRFLNDNSIRFAVGVAWEEQQWLMRILMSNPSVIRADCPFYIYNVGDHPSISTKVTAKHFMDVIDAVYAAIAELEEANPPAEVREVAEAFIANTIAKGAIGYFCRASAQARTMARRRLNEKYVWYANQTQLLPPPLRRIGPAFVSGEEPYKAELELLLEAKRKAEEAEAARNAKTPDA